MLTSEGMGSVDRHRGTQLDVAVLPSRFLVAHVNPFFRRVVSRCLGLILAGIVGPLSLLARPPAGGTDLPRFETRNGRTALIVDGAPFLMLGAQVNNSSAWPSEWPKVWPAMERIHANTVEAPVYWEQIEKSPGAFDFSVVDTLLREGRAHHVRLVLLWFGTWKNGSAHYLPEWMKRAPEKFPNIVGKDGKEVDSPSPLSEATLAADVHAFSALMKHLKEADSEHTVIMVQVENEPGAWNSARDYSPAAQRAFEGPVPAELLDGLKKTADGTSGDWRAVFGDDADEYFHAWYVARYIGRVAAAGKAVYPLPLYTNAALRDPLDPGRPPKYESGGPTDNVIPLWKIAAPALDLLAPDIYLPESPRYFRVLELYAREDNPLFIPETGSGPNFARYFFSALGHGAVGFSPFGIDYTRYASVPFGAPALTEDRLAPFALIYQLVGPMGREIAKLSFDGKLQGASEPDDQQSQVLHFPGWDATVSFTPSRGQGSLPPNTQKPWGGALVAQLADNEFLVTGLFSKVTFAPTGPAAGKAWQYIRVEEGQYVHGVFTTARIWNGDQTDWGLNFSSGAEVLRVLVSTR